ncbi:DUF1120 domain-containing protein [Pseudomonas sp. PCH199]|uniref:DUF1120 domain-containing protein n=1 Tax=unclassified Pseudomonas TaxID=196821 RepID=UPI000BD0A92B|nr:DUF1120 domain-containing protein [Pseudomonas sp. PCH199]PAM84169.1 hypothetical protein CES87_06095 [Pseudomonas sp. ERMR1:02]
MKKYLAALSTTALICVAPHALAASSTDLTVTGSITPGACTPALSSGGIVDYGKISAKDLDPVKDTWLSRQPLQLTVSCEASTRFALQSLDNKAGTATNDEYFGIGLTPANEKIGMLDVSINSTLADAQQAQAIGSKDGGATWKKQNYIDPLSLSSVAAASDHSTPIPVKDLAMELQVAVGIAGANSLTLTDEVSLEGSVTIQVKYL